MAKHDLYRVCALCGSTRNIEEHHIFGGSNRRNSTRYGMVIDVCSTCHRTGPKAIHNNDTLRRKLMQDGQRRFEETHTRAEFMKIFGRNYLDD